LEVQETVWGGSTTLRLMAAVILYLRSQHKGHILTRNLP